jgi:hypothetical protein
VIDPTDDDQPAKAAKNAPGRVGRSHHRGRGSD